MEKCKGYIFIVEVDKDVAIACYERGLADLNVIWPDIMSACVVADNAQELYRAKRDKKAEEESRENARKLLGKEVVRTRALPKTKWWHVPKYVKEVEYLGVSEERLDRYMLLNHRPPSWFYLSVPTMVQVYTKLRDRLDSRLQHLKLSSLPTLRMEEKEALEMKRWGDGSEIERVKKDLKLKGKDDDSPL